MTVSEKFENTLCCKNVLLSRRYRIITYYYDLIRKPNTNTFFCRARTLLGARDWRYPAHVSRTHDYFPSEKGAMKGAIYNIVGTREQNK